MFWMKLEAEEEALKAQLDQVESERAELAQQTKVEQEKTSKLEAEETRYILFRDEMVKVNVCEKNITG